MKTEQNNFEKQVRKQLAKREINPSENSWSKLEAMLDAKQSKQKKQSRLWWYVAASFVLLIGFYALKFNKNTVSGIEPANEIAVEQQTNNDTVSKNIKLIEPHHKATVQNQNPLATVQTVNDNFISTPQKTLQTQNTTKQEANSIEQNNIAVVVENQHKQEPAVMVTQDHKISVNADALLSSVENSPDIERTSFNGNSYANEQTFREKIIKKIEKNYKSAKTAIVNRNIE